MKKEDLEQIGEVMDNKIAANNILLLKAIDAMITARLEPIINNIVIIKTNLSNIQTLVQSINTRLEKIETRMANIEVKVGEIHARTCIVEHSIGG